LDLSRIRRALADTNINMSSSCARHSSWHCCCAHVNRFTAVGIIAAKALRRLAQRQAKLAMLETQWARSQRAIFIYLFCSVTPTYALTLCCRDLMACKIDSSIAEKVASAPALLMPERVHVTVCICLNRRAAIGGLWFTTDEPNKEYGNFSALIEAQFDVIIIRSWQMHPQRCSRNMFREQRHVHVWRCLRCVVLRAACSHPGVGVVDSSATAELSGPISTRKSACSVRSSPEYWHRICFLMFNWQNNR